MVICREWDADLHVAQLMPLLLTISCFSISRLVLPFWYRLTCVVPDKGPLNGCVCVCVVVLFFGWWMRTFVVLGWVFFIPEKETGFGKRLRNDLFCAEWDIKPQLNQSVSHRVRTTQPKLCAWSGWHMTDGNELWRPGNSCRETRSVMFSHKTAVSAKFIFSSKLAVTRMKRDDGSLFMCIDRYLLFYHKQILEYEWGRYVNIHESFRILLLLPRQL